MLFLMQVNSSQVKLVWIGVRRVTPAFFLAEHLQPIRNFDISKGYQTRLNGVIRWARMNGCPIAQM